MKTSHLIPPLLDYFVAKANDNGCSPEIKSLHGPRDLRPASFRGVPFKVDVSSPTSVCFVGGEPFEPSSNWADGGPILYRDKIATYPIVGYKGEDWEAESHLHPRGEVTGCGPTPLIAGMRCKVASVFGAEVPDDNPVSQGIG